MKLPGLVTLAPAILLAMVSSLAPASRASAGWMESGPSGLVSQRAEAADSTATGEDLAASPDSAATGEDLAVSADSASTDEELAASTDPPWIPPTRIRGEEIWESTLRFPFRVAGLPFFLAGAGLRSTLFFVEQANVVQRVTVLLTRVPSFGMEYGPASLGDRTGLGVFLGYRPGLLHKVLGAEVSGSTLGYARTKVNAIYGPAEFAYSYDWRPRERFFGYGLSSLQDEHSSYAVRTQGFLLGLAYPWQHSGMKPPREQLRIWGGPRESILLRGREEPSFQTVHPSAAPLLNERQEHFRFGVGLVVDRREGHPHWTHGARGAIEVERFQDATSKLFAIRTARGDSPDFTRASFEAEGGFSFFRKDPRTVRLAVRVVDQTGSASTDRLLPSDLSTLGGSQWLTGFEPGRFHDVDLVVTRLRYLCPLSRNLEFEIHAESGGVYPRLRDARLSSLEQSYGFSFRPRLDTGLLASVGLDWCDEGLRFRFSLGAVE